MTPYRIEVRNSPDWNKHTVATLGVSVTSPNWQDDKFAAILAFATKRFTTIRIDVTDALYRHGFMVEGMAGEEALACANSLGALWLARHADVIAACPVAPAIVRWAAWYDHPDYETTLKQFQTAHQSNPVLSEAVRDDIAAFYRRKGREPSPVEHQGSANYFIEELAVITLQARALSGLRIYPGDELRCFSVVRRGLVPEAPSGLEQEQYARIKFESRGRQRNLVPSSTPQTALCG